MPAAFKSAAEIPPRRALRLHLKPVTLGHVFLLHEFASPYVTRDAKETIPDIYLAAVILANDWKTARRLTQSRLAPLFFAALGAITRRDKLQDSRNELVMHLRDWCYTPPVQSDGKGKALTAPWHVRLYASMRHLFHMEHDEAMSLTVLEASALRAAIGEDLGKIELRSQDSIDFVEQVKAMRAMATEEERDAYIAAHNAREMAQAGRN